MQIVLWFVAAVLVVIGFVELLSGHVLWGILVIVLGFGVGPGGWTIYNKSKIN